MNRTLFHLGLIFSALFMPWWFTFILLIVACFVLESFYEAVLYGIALDALYGTSYGIDGYRFVWTTMTAVLFIVSQPIRRRLSW